MPNDRPTFADALGALLAEYADTDSDTLISAMELQIMALKEEAHDEDQNGGGP
jgi:hypothetical protein